MNSIVYALFPTTVTQSVYPDSDSFLELFYQHWEGHFSGGLSGESSGRNAVHHQKEFAGLFTFITECVQQYLETIGIEHRNFDINIVKSWLNSSTKAPLRMHTHGDSHLSVVYYAATPEDGEQTLTFVDSSHDRDPYVGISGYNAKEWNPYGAKAWDFETRKGQVFVFPSNTLHYNTRKDETNAEEPLVGSLDDIKTKRICVACDILLTYSDVSSKHLGIQPVTHWRKFH
jgi:hypothetical protein